MVDFSNEIVTLLAANWTPGNTDSVTPKIEQVYNRKSSKMTRVAADDGEFVFVFDDIATQKESGVNSTFKNTLEQAKIMILSAVTRAHFIKVKEEVIRILGVNFAAPFTDYQEIEVLRQNDLSDGRKKQFKIIMDIEAKRLHVARS